MILKKYYIICNKMRNITIYTNPHHYTLYIENVIAYYPTDSFLIYEGYTTLQNDKLPMNAVMDTYYPKTKINTMIDIEITNVWRKDLQDKPLTPEEIEKMKCKCGPNSDCDCNITFFPTYLVILEFKNIKRQTDFPNHDLIKKEEWNYCIDNRFPSSEELLSAYKALIDLPEGCSFTNYHREEDLAFYLAYYDEYENGINKYELSDKRMGELKEVLDSFWELKERKRAEAQQAFKERQETYKALKEKEDSVDKSKNFLSADKIIGINTVGASLRSETDKLRDEDDLIARILKDINEPMNEYSKK